MDQENQNNSKTRNEVKIPSSSPLSPSTKKKMIAVALLLDLISLIPVANFATTAAAPLIFSWWFKKCGCNPFGPKKVVNYIIGLVVEIIPIISFLPGITFTVVRNIAVETATASIKPKSLRKINPARRIAAGQRLMRMKTSQYKNRQAARSRVNTVQNQDTQIPAF